MGTILTLVGLLGIVFLFLAGFGISTPRVHFGWLGLALLALVAVVSGGAATGIHL